MTKKCFRCGETKPLDDFYRHRYMGDGHLNKCKSCTRSDVNQRYRDRFDNDPEWRERERQRGREKYHRRQYRKKITSHHKAANAVDNAVRDGRLEKPDKCSECGDTDTRIEGHHPDYGKPLAVVWLCTICHGKRHRRQTA